MPLLFAAGCDSGLHGPSTCTTRSPTHPGKPVKSFPIMENTWQMAEKVKCPGKSRSVGWPSDSKWKSPVVPLRIVIFTRSVVLSMSTIDINSNLVCGSEWMCWIFQFYTFLLLYKSSCEQCCWHSKYDSKCCHFILYVKHRHFDLDISSIYCSLALQIQRSP